MILILTKQELIQLINSFDANYEMSDSYKTYQKHKAIDIKIRQQLKRASEEVKAEVANSIKDYYVTFFKLESYVNEATESTEVAPKSEPKQKPSTRSNTSSKHNRGKIMREAWAIYKRGICAFGEAIRLAWKKEKVVNSLLRNKWNDLTFVKEDGEVREATGMYKPSDTPAVILFHDFDKKALRSFRVDRLLSYQAA